MRRIPISFVSLLLLPLVLPHDVSADITGVVSITDGTYVPVGEAYPGTAMQVYAEVRDGDEDVSTGVDSVEVMFTSGAADSETVFLQESSPGVFRGSIALDVMSRVLFKGRPLGEWMREIRTEEKDLEEQRRKQAALMQEFGMELKRRRELKTSDGIVVQLVGDRMLQIRYGQAVRVTYHDRLNAYGSEQDIGDEAIFNGVAGAVSGVWRRANSPYVVVDNVWVEFDSVLVIEPGVEVRFTRDTGMAVFGQLEAAGAEGDSIRFTSHEEPPAAGDWSGIQIRGVGGEISYAVFEYGQYPVQVYGLSGSWVLRNSFVRRSAGTGIYASTLYARMLTIRDCRVEDNSYYGLQLYNNYYYGSYSETRIVGTAMRRNGHGINCDGRLSLMVDSTVVEENRGIGIQVQGDSTRIRYSSVVNNDRYGLFLNTSVAQVYRSNLHGNSRLAGSGSQYDLVNYSVADVDAQYCFWDC